MAKLTMIKGQMVLTADSSAEEKRLTELAYAGADVGVTKASKSKSDDKKADD